MRLHLLAAAVGLTLALAGCASSGGLHPDGTPMDPASLKSERSLATFDVSPASWPAQDWWTGLGDPQLDALITEALQDNPNLAVADARARQAQAQVGVADAARGPSVNAGASVAGARLPTTLPPPIGSGHFGLAKYGYASFKWDLDLWGGKRAAWQAALGAARAADVEQRAARIEVSGNVARGYVQLGYAYAQQDVAKAELERADNARKLTTQRVTAGIDNQIQLKQSDAEVASAQEQLALADRAIDAACSALSVLLGKGPDRGLDIGRPQVLKPSTLAVPANLSVDLLGHRADLVAARWRVEAASKDIKAAKTQFMPNVSLSAMAGVIGLGGGTNIFQLPARFYEGGPAISLPIFDGGRLRSNLAGKDAEYDLAVAQYNQTLVGAVNEVADHLSALRSLQEQMVAEQHALDAASQAWQLAQQRFKSGIGSYLEALSVRQQLLVADQRMAALQSQQVDLSVQLIQALGGGFRPQADDAELANHSNSPRF
ncbi:efflux transporter outer membrane subunit [Dyella tabacisoli]|uniref:Multidrug RND transporter n=1 Tax=Dyella tabacisoli TaxID=2282381 RepID=A0A369ULA3_9GAMM|nr:efflux transporter outer membrane subunit [Dyella tabacisoli]RDD80865.1 multidrug RND transporter [Dyella tabacisoli]